MATATYTWTRADGRARREQPLRRESVPKDGRLVQHSFDTPRWGYEQVAVAVKEHDPDQDEDQDREQDQKSRGGPPGPR
jgi:hypothetical protein